MILFNFFAKVEILCRLNETLFDLAHIWRNIWNTMHDNGVIFGITSIIMA